MNMKKWLCMALALVMTLGAFALAEGGDLQVQLDVASARIAELEAQVEKYRPFYDAQVVAEFGEDGVVWLEDCQAQYDQVASMYAQYGMSPEAIDPSIKQTIVEGQAQNAVRDAKIKELGLDELDEATLDGLNAKAAEDLENYVNYYSSYFATEGATEQETHDATVQGLAGAGITQEALLQDRIEEYAVEQLHDYVTRDVEVSEEEIKAAYDALLAEDQETYANGDSAFVNAYTNGDAIAWNPEGYRAVKHVLVKFNDDQTARYQELQSMLAGLEDELAALDEAEANGADAETAEVEAAEAADAANADETVEAPRTREEIQADVEAADTSLTDLYAELMPRAKEVIDAFNGGADFDSLIDQYNEDPGMTREPTRSKGYPVHPDSMTWDPAFTEGAMSIDEAGQISEPVFGANGIHIIYYLADITPGEVAYEDIKEDVKASALAQKVSDTYNAQLQAWVEEANVVYHLDRF